MRRLTEMGLFLLLCSCLIDSVPARAADVKKSMSLEVTVEYTGSGTVDATHQLVVFVYETDYIGHRETPPPLATGATAENRGTVKLQVAKSPAYVAVFYDKDSRFKAGVKDMPSGAPAALYGESPAQADPIKLTNSKPTTIKISFDDTITLP